MSSEYYSKKTKHRKKLLGEINVMAPKTTCGISYPQNKYTPLPLKMETIEFKFQLGQLEEQLLEIK